MARLVLVLIFTFPMMAFSQAGGKSRRFLFEINSMFGYGSAKIATDAAAPTIGSFNLGVGLGINIKKFTIGLGADYRILTQHSDVDPTVGNRRGTFISPTSLLIRINFEKIKFGLLLISNGSYDLTNITANGKKLKYTNPNGFRFDLIFKKFAKLTPLVFYESVNFSGSQLDGVPSVVSSNLNYSNFGAGIKYDF
ncbi:MAG: hypothetical protein AABY53_01540 [Bdellovibrionota bacterium]